MTGVVRPNPSRVFKNITNSIRTLSSYDCQYHIMVYRSSLSIELCEMVENCGLPLKINLIDPITKTIGGHNGNSYRMFRNIELLIKSIENIDSYDCVFRHRVDSELNEIELPTQLDDATYYSPMTSWGPFDNIGFSSPDVFKKIFTTEDISIFGGTPHDAMANNFNKFGISTKPFNFNKILYQTSDDMFDGVAQWSKQNRRFEYRDGWITMDGKVNET